MLLPGALQRLNVLSLVGASLKSKHMPELTELKELEALSLAGAVDMNVSYFQQLVSMTALR